MVASAPVVKSITNYAGAVVSGSTDVNQLILNGTAEAGSTVNVFDGTTFLGTTTAASSGAWAFAPSALSAGTHSFTASDTDATGTSVVSAATAVNIVPNITSFSATNMSHFTVDGSTVEALNANQPWSLTNPDPSTLQFQVRSGDYWSTSGWSDLTNDGGANRSEIEFPTYNAGTQINVSYGLTVQPGPVNNASFFELGHLDSNDASRPSPVNIFLDQSDHMQVCIQTPSSNWVLLYQDPNPIVRGQTYQMNLQMEMDPSGNTGFVNVWRDGVEIASYHGAIGSAGAQYSWHEGIYRGPSTQTQTLDFSNTQITTGPAPVPPALPQETLGGTPPSSSTSSSGTTSGSTTGTTTGTTSSGSTTPPAAPTGLADAAIVNGYVNAARDTTTQQLTGSAEAGSAVSVYDGTSKLGTATAASNGSWSYTLGHLADGSHSLTATATDAAGTSAASAPLAFKVDTQAPATPTLAAYSQAGSAVGGSTTLTDIVLKGTAEAGSTIKVDDGTTQIGTATTGSSGAWSFDTGTIALGSHSFTATATDIAGNTSAASAADAVTITSTTASTTPVAPTVTVASNSLYVSPGGSIPLGLSVSVPNAGDNVTVTISGLPKYETITDNLDHKTFSGSSVTLTAAEVNSGLSLSSSYQGNGRPRATLTVTATDNTGTPITSSAQTITVVDPPATTTSSSTSTTTSVTSSDTSTTTTSGDGRSWGQSHHYASQSFNHHPDFARAATTLSDTGASNVASTPTMTTTDPAAGAVAKAYALLNQMMAGDFGRESHFAQTATALSASSQQQADFLARPLH